MDFFKFLGKQWFKLLIVLPVAPIVFLINALDRFSGLDGLLRFLIAATIVLFYLLLILTGSYFAVIKLKTGKVIVGVLTASLLFATTYGAVMANRVVNVLDNVTTNPVEQRGYSLVVMADFNAEALNGYGRIGILTIVEEAKEEARAAFLAEQTFIPSPITTNFDGSIEMIIALYAGEIDAMIISSNFVQLFDELEGLEGIEYETKVLATFDVTTQQDERLEMDPEAPFSLLILGLDAADADEISAGQIDTFMLATFNIDDLSFTLVSIPRDSFVEMPCQNYLRDKLAHVNSSGGIACAISTVENLMEMEIDYYVMVNMTAVVDIVDAIGGITVDVPFTVWEQDSNRSEERPIHLEEGVRLLDGEQALALARHRRTLLDADFGRMRHTQLVLEAMMREGIESLSSVNDAVNLLEIMSRNMRTNMTVHEITLLVQYLIEFLPTVGVSYLMDEIHFMNMTITGATMDVTTPLAMNVVIPSELQIAEARRLMFINLGLKDPEFLFTFEFDAFAEGGHVWLQPDYAQEIPWFGTQTEPVPGMSTLPVEPAVPWQPVLPADQGLPGSQVPPIDQGLSGNQVPPIDQGPPGSQVPSIDQEPSIDQAEPAVPETTPEEASER